MRHPSSQYSHLYLKGQSLCVLRELTQKTLVKYELS